MRDFLIQRYSCANWDAVRGLVPFVVTGPAFERYTVPGSLDRVGEHRMTPTFLATIGQVMGGEDHTWRDVVAEWLLAEGILQALWSVDSRECLPPEARWVASVAQVAREIPADSPVVEGVVELLSGVSDPGHYRSYVSEDSLTLEPCPVP